MNTTIEGYNGVIAEQTSEQDYQLVAGVLDLPRARHTFEENKIQYDQREIGIYTCTIHGAITAMSALTGIRFTEDQRNFLYSEAKKDGFIPGVGWYINKAVDLVRKWSTVWFKEEFVSYRVTLGSLEHEQNAEKGYLFVMGRRCNATTSLDSSDGRIDNVTETKFTFSHCLSEGDVPADVTDDEIIDNYVNYTDGVNIYKITKEKLAQAVKNGMFFKDAYVFAFKQDVMHPPSLVSSFAVNSVEKAKKYGILDWSNPQQPVDSVLLEDILKKLGLLTVDTDKGCSKERLIVALDRANLLN